jgi:photosystem II stability/assembly factor-like uncharacterized protein
MVRVPVLSIPIALFLVLGALPVHAEDVSPGGKADEPKGKLFERWLWHWERRALSTRDSVAGTPARALNPKGAMSRAAPDGKPEYSSPKGRWIGIGPAPIQGGQIGLRRNERPVVGRVRTVAVDPDDQNHWLIGAAQGGIWETFDAGKTWRAVTDDQCSLAMGAIAFGPHNPETARRIVYAGTGEALPVSIAYGGHGLLVYGHDRSDTWQRRPPPEGTDLCSKSDFEWLAFSRLLVDPRKPGHLIAATMVPGHRPASAKLPQEHRRYLGVITSPDGGRTWSPQATCDLPGDVQPGGATDVVANPDSAGSFAMYAGLKLDKAPDDFRYGVYRLKNNDCWTLIGGTHADDLPTERIGRVEFAFSPPATLYVSLEDHGLRSNGLRGLWRSDNAWDEVPRFKRVELTGGRGSGPGDWGYCGAHPTVGVQRARNARYKGLCDYSHTISVDPGDPGVIYAGGIGLWKARVTCSPDDSRCTADWTEISHLTSGHARTPRIRRRGIHVDQHAMAWAGRRLIVANDGGLWSTTDGGASWQDHNHGLSVVQFYAGAVAEHDGQLLILGGTQDNGTVRWTGSSWSFVKGGDAGRPVISSRHPATHWGLSYVSVVDGRTIQRTQDAGNEFVLADSPIRVEKREYYFPGPPLAACGSHEAPDIVAAAAGEDVWTSSSFFTSATSPTWDWLAVVPDGATIRTLAFDPRNCEVLAVAARMSDGSYQIRGTPDLSGTPRELQFLKVGAFSSPISALAFDPGADRLYVTFGDLTGLGAIRIDDVFGRNGGPWSVPLETEFPAPHNAVAVVPDKKDNTMMHVWIGTDIGVLHGHCDRTWTYAPCRWTHHGAKLGMPHVAVTDIQISPSGQVVAFTFGRGVFLFVEGDGWCDGKHRPVIGTNFGSCVSKRPIRRGERATLIDQ